MNESRRRAFNLAGWFLFIVSALFFIVSALRSGDIPGLLGGVFFLIACIAFVIPLVTKPPN